MLSFLPTAIESKRGEQKVMETSDIAEFARNFSVMVRIQGPDPKGLKMRNHSFHLHQSGTTTLSASGLLLPPGSLSHPPTIIEHIASIHHHTGAIVITMATVIEPFLVAQHRDNPTKEIFLKLIPEAYIDVLPEGKKDGSNWENPGTSPCWAPSKLLAIVDVPASSDMLMSLIGSHGGSSQQTSWELAWSLAPLGNDPRTGGSGSHRQVENDSRFSERSFRSLSMDDSNNATGMVKAATRIAFLGVSALDHKDVLNIEISQPQKRGDFLLVMGSPFGVLSSFHFYNSISIGTVANCCPSGSHCSSLLMADIHCLPGMEGAPVFDKQGFLIGILIRPLRQKGGTAEIQLVIPWDAIANVGSNELLNTNNAQKTSLSSSKNLKRFVKDSARCPDIPSLSKSSLEKALSSIALITVGDDVWASGVLINKHGLVLTNAHILEPRRFERKPLLGLMDESTTKSFEQDRNSSQQEENVDLHGHGSSFLNSNYRSYKRISVRLHHKEQHIWYGARVAYVSKGPWDIALLQIESIPDQLFPITPELACPAIGSTVHVIGHGLLGPRSDISPSIMTGVLANVVRIPGPINLPESRKVGTERTNVPVMLQTTAAIHPGASGGAVVNSDGCLIGLVTSNARHGGGTIIPHLNFSIPCAALEPIFKFSDKQDSSILKALEHPNEVLSSVWALTPPPATMPRAPSEENDKESRGSHFSQFLAEKRVEFNPLKDQKHLIAGKFHSKI